MGIDSAFTFRGFCEDHDREVFAPVERHQYDLAADNSALLFCYRTLLNECRKKEKNLDWWARCLLDDRLKQDRQRYEEYDMWHGIGTFALWHMRTIEEKLEANRSAAALPSDPFEALQKLRHARSRRASRRAMAAREATAPLSSWRCHSAARSSPLGCARPLAASRCFLAAPKSTTQSLREVRSSEEGVPCRNDHSTSHCGLQQCARRQEGHTVPDQKPTRDRPLLVGVVADVSGSMFAAMGDAGSRLESFRDSLHDLADRAVDLSAKDAGDGVAPSIKMFAYGFGFGGLWSFLSRDSEPVRDLLELPNAGTSTVAIDDLARNWDRYEEHLERLSRSMGGGTPMLAGFHAVRDRFIRERAAAKYTSNPVLFVLSDGVPSERTGGEREIVAAAREMQAAGVTIVSCYVTDENIAQPRRLYAQLGPHWPPGAKLMFECASQLQASSEFEQYLAEYDWAIEAQCRLFTQINQSEILSEFLSLVLSPIREGREVADRQKASRTNTKVGRVFVSYSHKDKRWLERLRVYLRPLERSEMVEIWDDEQIRPGHDWRRHISEALDRATVAVLLVTADFLASDFIATNELPALLEAASQRGLVVLPLIVSASAFSDMPSLSRYQAVNSPERPLNGLKTAERDRVLVDLGRRIQALAMGDT